MLRLTDQEKQEVIRFLEADRELPEKYRFLLFEDKREVELVWNGKTNEVCNIVLPFQTIEQVDEPRQETPSHSPLSGGEQLAFFSTDNRGRHSRAGPISSSGVITNCFFPVSRMARCVRRLRRRAG